MTIATRKRASLIGTNAIRLDATEKVTGKGLYGGDQQIQGMLYARVFRSTVPHALIRRLDVSRARALPGVRAVITAAAFIKHRQMGQAEAGLNCGGGDQ